MLSKIINSALFFRWLHIITLILQVYVKIHSRIISIDLPEHDRKTTLKAAHNRHP